MLGSHSELDPPDSIPNSEVKRLSADDSVGSPHVKVGRCQACYPEPQIGNYPGLFYMGIEIVSVETEIKSFLTPDALQRYSQWYCFDAIDSTNTFLYSKLDELKDRSVCVAHTQTAGRGRRGKPWISEPSKGLYLSVAFDKKQFSAPLEGFSCALGLSLIHALKPYSIPLTLKWPNDVWIDNAKCAGILVEIFSSFIIVGLGLNFLTPSKSYSNAIGLESYIENVVDQVPKITAQVLTELDKSVRLFAQEGFTPFVAEANHLNLLYNRPFTCLINNTEVEATSGVISADGTLIVYQINGEKRICYSGEVSLKL